jgi:hypothetical protein
VDSEQAKEEGSRSDIDNDLVCEQGSLARSSTRQSNSAGGKSGRRPGTLMSMARPAKHIPTSLEEALAELKRDPANAVHARIDGMDVELRAVPPSPSTDEKLGDWMASAGPWQGETEEEILEILRDARRAGGSAEPPEMP